MTLAVALACVAAAQAPVEERFDTGVNGFSFYGDASVFGHDPTGGNPGGAIVATDLNTGIVWGFTASSAFLGDKSAYLNGTFSFDVVTTHGGNASASEPDLALVGAGLVLVFNLPSLSSGVWTARTAPLFAAAGWRIGANSGPVPSEAQFLAVLSDLTEIRMRPEYSNSVDTGRLDNVVLAPPAAPCVTTIFCNQAPIAPCVPQLVAFGHASLTNPAPFILRLDDAPTASFAILFYGVGPRIAAPGMFGTVCVGGPHRRLPPIASGGDPMVGPCDGTFVLDLGPHLRSGVDPTLVVGANFIAHLWYRYGAAPGGAAFSAAVEATVCP